MGSFAMPTLDLRQPILIPSPLEVLTRTNDIDVTAESTSFRPIIAFGLVAMALSTMGATIATSTQHLAQAAEARSVIPSGFKGLNLPAAVPIKSQLQSLLNSFTAADASNWGVVVTNLKTGETASVNANASMESASLYKLFVAQAVYKAIDSGQLQSSDYIQGCLQTMITVSDNDCGRALGTIVGWEALNPGLASAGYSATDMTNPAQHTSAHDVALLLQRLYQGSLASPTSNASFLNLLKGQLVNNRLPVGLPSGTVIDHKTGDLDGYIHDAGIVYGPKSDYLIVAMSGPWGDPGNAPGRIAQLSSQLYSYFEN
jgi:beta-lactamase class A